MPKGKFQVQSEALPLGECRALAYGLDADRDVKQAAFVLLGCAGRRQSIAAICEWSGFPREDVARYFRNFFRAGLILPSHRRVYAGWVGMKDPARIDLALLLHAMVGTGEVERVVDTRKVGA